MLAAKTTERGTKTRRERPTSLAGSMAALLRYVIDGAWQTIRDAAHGMWACYGELWDVLLTTAESLDDQLCGGDMKAVLEPRAREIELTRLKAEIARAEMERPWPVGLLW